MKVRPVLTVAILFASACADEPRKSVAPTAPPPSRSVTTATPGMGASTVCLSYARDLALARAELKDKPTSERALKRASSLDRLIQDACQ